MNLESYTRYNAASNIYSRGSQSGEVPGYAAANVCQNPNICNPAAEMWLSPDWLASQLETRSLDDGICSELLGCWSAQADMEEGGEEGETTLPIPSRGSLGGLDPHEVALIPLAQIVAL